MFLVGTSRVNFNAPGSGLGAAATIVVGRTTDTGATDPALLAALTADDDTLMAAVVTGRFLVPIVAEPVEIDDSGPLAADTHVDMALVTLTAPNLKLNSKENKPTQATAARGVYDQRSQRVQLSGGVAVSDVGSGYRFDTERTTIDTKTGVISGDSPVRGSGPLGQFSASSYAVYDQGSRMTFKGNVRARINARTTK